MGSLCCYKDGFIDRQNQMNFGGGVRLAIIIHSNTEYYDTNTYLTSLNCQFIFQKQSILLFNLFQLIQINFSPHPVLGYQSNKDSQEKATIIILTTDNYKEVKPLYSQTHHFQARSNSNSMQEIQEKLGQFDFSYNTYDRHGASDQQKANFRNFDYQQLELRQPITLQNNSRYQGEWSKQTALRHGRGIQIWPDGSKYQGFWKNDKAQGRGRLIHSDGDVYEGQWKDDKANGKGIYIHFSGATYQGDWLDDKQHGFGLQKWEDGANYQGDYRFGKKHGKGKFIWADGSRFQGDFYQNGIQGEGVYRWQDGRQYSGQWQDNKMHGEGTFKWPDNRIYQGNYLRDQKQGFGIFIWPDGRRYEGPWHQGLQQGQGIMVSAKGIQRRGYYNKGRRLKWLDKVPLNVNPRDYSDSNFQGRNRTVSNKSDRQFTLGEDVSQ